MGKSAAAPESERQDYEMPAWKLQQTDLVYAGLAGIAIVFVQDYVAIGELDPAATISLMAFAVALPLLGALGVLNAIQAGYRFAPYPWWMTIAVTTALGASGVGIAAGFWSVSELAGGVVVLSAVVGAVLVAAYRGSLERANPGASAPASSPGRAGRRKQP